MRQLKSLDGSVVINIGELEYPPTKVTEYGYVFQKFYKSSIPFKESESSTDLKSLYNSIPQSKRISGIEFPGGFVLRVQRSGGNFKLANGNLNTLISGRYNWGLFPKSLDNITTLTNIGVVFIHPMTGDSCNFGARPGNPNYNLGSTAPDIEVDPSHGGYNYVCLCHYGDTYYYNVETSGYPWYNYYTNVWVFESTLAGDKDNDTFSSINTVEITSYINQILGSTPTPPPGGGSTEGGGDGDFDNTTTTIPLPDLPIISLANLGIVKQYQIGQSDITNLSNFLWDTGFETLFTKWMQDPTEALISLRMCPVPPITETDPTQVYIGSVEALGVNGNLLTERYIEVDMGTLTIPPYWGNFLDYNPHTKVEVYIPYSGFQKLDTDIVMNSTINLRYRIDYLSGEAVAIILVDKGKENLQAPIYEFPVNIFSEIPLTSKSSDLYRNALQLIGASAVAGIGAAAGGMTAGLALVNATASATNVVNSKETVQKVGGTGGSIGFMGVQTPYLIINRPEQSVPDDYNKFYGYPCNMWETLGNLEGYTVVERIHLENIIATSEELDLIEKELKSGVIL